MCGLEAGGDSVAINRYSGNCKLNPGLCLSLLGGKDEQLGLAPD